MKLVSLFYPSTEIRHSLSIILFFRMVGIYVYEVQTDIDIFEQNNEAIASSDAIVYLSCDETNIDNIAPFEKKLYLVDYQLLDDLSVYDVILPILQYFSETYIMDYDEYVDLKAALTVFDKCYKQYIKVTLLGKYYFEQKLEDYIADIYKEYIEVGLKIAKPLQKESIPLWGENRYLHCRYAFINIFFEMDLFCKKNNRDYYMDIDSMINACSHIEKEDGNYIGNSFKMLRAQINDSLSENISEAFKLYVDCCDNYYDSYVYFCKAEMMYKKKELDRAVDYYKQSTSIYPQYYRAWFKLGICYLEMNDINKYQKEARECFEKVSCILSNKAANNLLRAIEYEYLFNSYINITNIDRISGAYLNALGSCERAWKIYRSIGNNKFYSELDINYPYIKDDILSHLDVGKLKKYGIELSTMFDLDDNAMKYAKL